MVWDLIKSGIDTFSNVANTVAPLVGPAQQILGAIRGPQMSSVPSVPTPQAETYVTGLLQQLADPNSRLLADLQAKEFGNLYDSFGGDIKRMQMADRRSQALGRDPTFFAPERRDEQVNYLMSRGAPQLQQQARQNALENILSATGVKGFAGAQAGRALEYQKRQAKAMEDFAGQQQAAGGLPGRIGTAVQGIEDIMDIFGKNRQDNIIWNERPQAPQSMVYKY
jgi:hypothetical protein